MALRDLIIFLALIGVTVSFYLPGLAPKTYCSNKGVKGCPNAVELYVNKLDSDRSVLPFDYSRFPFCQATSVKHAPGENIGQVLFGERIAASPIQFEFGQKKTCSKVCDKTIKNPNGAAAKENKKELKQVQLLLRAVQLNYQHHWIVDNLPVLYCYQIRPFEGAPLIPHCDRSIPIGCFVNEKGEPKGFCAADSHFNKKKAHYLFNHYKFTITYHPADSKTEWSGQVPEGAVGAGRIVKVLIELSSTQQKWKGDACDVADTPPEYLFRDGVKDQTVSYSYEVNWKMNDTIKWSSRWDYVLDSIQEGQIQWFQIFNSLVIVLFMSGMIAMILLRTLHRDIARYNQEDTEDAQEEFGWKLVHGDVFRPPSKGMLLSVLLANGTQLFIMTLITLFFACFGFLSPANRGFLMTCAVVCYVLMGTPAGYVSARIYKMFGGERWKSNVLLTAFLIPGLIFGAFFLLNLVLWGEGSSAAIPFGTLVGILALWFGVSAPLTFVGAYFGFKRAPIENPVRTNQIPRQIPDQSCYTRPLPSIFMGAILPFGCIFLQLFFIFNSIWAHHVYYMFGFLFLVFIILVITCSETAILLCYFHLCAEDYNWWWRSFLTTGFTAVYLFGYCIHFFVTKMAISGAASTFLFFGYTLMMIFIFFLLTGCIGFFSCFWFIRRIYSVVKVD